MADESFDPYRKWLGIPKRDQPPHYYRLLGIEWFEDDPEVIEAAADRQMAHVRTYQAGRHSDASQRLLNELSQARVSLLNPEKKAAYDEDLRKRLLVAGGVVAPAGPPFGYFVRGAGRYVMLASQRLWVRWVRLPDAYRGLGEHAYGENLGRDQLGDTYARLDLLTRDLASLRPASPPTPEGEAPPLDQEIPEEPAKLGFFARLSTFVRGELFDRRRRHLLTRLGREVLSIDPPLKLPDPLVKLVRDNLDRLENIRHQIAAVSQVPPGHFLSGKRLVWIVVGCIGGMMLFVWILGQIVSM